MQIVSKKNFMIFLAAVLVVALGFMALTLSKKKGVNKPAMQAADREIKTIQNQSSSDNVGDIEKDLNETDLTDLDKELQDIENELESTY